MDFSVVIPTYNGAERLPKVLDCLQAQEVPPDLQWEIIIVDNNSRDETAAIVEQYQSTWNIDVPLRYVFEPLQGAAFARQTGIRQAHRELVGFLDDDNLPATNWVAEAVEFGQQNPKVGAFGGKTEIPIRPTSKSEYQWILFIYSAPQGKYSILKFAPYFCLKNRRNIRGNCYIQRFSLW